MHLYAATGNFQYCGIDCIIQKPSNYNLSSGLNLFLEGKVEISGNFATSLFLTAANPSVNQSIDLFTSGISYSSNNLDLYLLGIGQFVSGNTNLHTLGSERINGSYGLYINGITDYGQQSNPLYLSGYVYNISGIDLYIKGQW